MNKGGDAFSLKKNKKNMDNHGLKVIENHFTFYAN